VQGALQLQNNDVTLFPELPPIQAALGRIEFSEHGVNLDGVGASFLGGPLQLSGGTQPNGAIVIRMNGSASAEGMRATARCRRCSAWARRCRAVRASTAASP
jgi:uncharacterized protein YhdP